jgi:HSP20 family molecular chaperone IbpA
MATNTKLTKRHEESPETIHEDQPVTPFVDIFENQDEILLLADMPGVQTKDLNVRVDKDTLILEGKKTIASDGNLIRCESAACTYTRSFSLPQTIDGAKIGASLDRGVLTVHLPKRESVKPRQIQVTAG